MGNKNVPELRFPGFDGDWVEKKLGAVLEPILRPIKMLDEEEYSLVTVKRRYGGIISRGIYKGKEVLVKSQFKLKTDDFLISKRQISHNACGIVPKELNNSIVSNEYSVLIPKTYLNIIYFDYFCHLPKVSNCFYLSSIGVHIEKMIFKLNDWFKWKFFFPNRNEQNKIASFLSSVDTKIDLLTKKKELMEQYKKGIMQKIFSQEIRFKDDNGNDYPDWEEKKLGEVCDVRDGTHESPKFYESGNIFLTSKNLNVDGTLDLLDVKYISDEDFNNYNKRSKVEVGDILFGMIGTIGNPVIVTINNFAFKNMAILKDIGLLTNTLLIYIINSHIVLRQFHVLNAGGTQKFIALGLIRSLKIPIPSSSEQQKIATFLSSIDNKIGLIDKELDSVKMFKKGLLQKMFV